MARVAIRKETFPLAFVDIYQAATNTVCKLNWQIIASNPVSGEIWAKTGYSFKSWGESIAIRIFAEPAGMSIEVTSKLTVSYYDWGKNLDNERDFFAAFCLEIVKLHLTY